MIQIGDNFSYLGAKPLDGRISYSTLSDMVGMADSTLYDGCMAYCVATDKNYQWKSANESDATLGKWREFESGGGGHTIYDDGVAMTDRDGLNFVDCDLSDDSTDNQTDVKPHRLTSEDMAEIMEVLPSPGGGGGGVSDYSDLTNKPSINGVTLTGNKTTSDLNISYNDLDDKPTTNYSTDDTASTDIADGDYFPFYDSSASAKKKSLWSNIKSVLKTYFDSIYQATMSAGTGITITGNTINATNTLPLNYSTSEQVVGTWIDGKPIYQKTLSTTIGSTGTAKSVSIGTTISAFASIEAMLNDGSGNWLPFTGVTTATSCINNGVFNIAIKVSATNNSAASNQNKIILLTSNSDWTGKTIYVTVQYTKTTD